MFLNVLQIRLYQLQLLPRISNILQSRNQTKTLRHIYSSLWAYELDDEFL